MPITGYQVSYSFAGFQALNPSTPLPAMSLDNELANIAVSIEAIIEAVDQVRRSDGHLQNGIVGFDSLDAQVQALLNLDPRITTLDINPAAFASQAEAEAGLAADKLMTPLATAQAIAARRAFATQAEAQAAAATGVVLSPATGKDLVNAQRPWASTAEGQAGVVEAKVMSPFKTAAAITAQRRAHTASAILTWGEIAAGASTAQTIAVEGAQINDRVAVGLPVGGLQGGIVMVAWVSAVDVVTIRLNNSTAGALTPAAAQTYSVTAMGF